MGCDETLMSCVNQDEQSLACWNDQGNQTLASWADQENMTPNTAQSVDDRSSRSENLQSVSNEVQRNGENASDKCEEMSRIGDNENSRGVKNSEIDNFVNRTYETSYKLPNENAAFKNTIRYPRQHNSVVPFNVKYTPKRKSSKSKLTIKMPVRFVGFSNERQKKEVKKAYLDSVHRIWSGKYRLHLKVLSSAKKIKGKLCDDWSKISPANVEVFVDDVDTNPTKAYEIHYNPDPSPYLSSTTSADTVTFTGWAYKNRYNRNQNVFAHEFGHQIGLDDEYAVGYDNGEYTSVLNNVDIVVYLNSERLVLNDMSLVYAYWAHELPEPGKLKVFERTKYKRQYTLPKEKSLFNHGGVDYSAELKTFNGKKGFVLYANGEELTTEFPGLKSRKPVEITDENGKHLVYFYDKLKAVEEPGPRTYDLEKFFIKGAKIYHNYREYSVGKGSVGQQVFYCLMRNVKKKRDGNVSAEMKNRHLDGSYTTHFNMADEEKFGKDYAQNKATMFNMDEIIHKRQEFRKNDQNLMNIGNVVQPHYYIPFKKGMVDAIQKVYVDSQSDKAPNMEQDWEIRK